MRLRNRAIPINATYQFIACTNVPEVALISSNHSFSLKASVSKRVSADVDVVLPPSARTVFRRAEVKVQHHSPEQHGHPYIEP